MKILTKEEEEEHYSATLKGGIGGGLVGLAVGFVGVYAATQRYPAFRSLTLPLKAFLVTSSGTFAAIISADKYSRSFEAARHPESSYQDESALRKQEAESRKSTYEKALDWGKENRYPIVGGSWVASMAIALGIVGRSPWLTTAQKIVQARVYAQGLTLAVLIATAAFEIGDKNEGQGRWETVKIIDPNDPTHKHLIEKKIHHETYAGEDQWRDMVESEERKMAERKRAVHAQEEQDAKKRKSDDKGKKADESSGGGDRQGSKDDHESKSSHKADDGKNDGGNEDDSKPPAQDKKPQ